jgi:hypothetical protein
MQLTAQDVKNLDRMNEASRLAGGLGTILLGGASLPDNGTLTPIALVKYTSAPALADVDAIHATITQTDAVQTITTGIGTLDYPRTITITGNASGNAGNVVVTGTNFAGATITDTIALSGTSTVQGAKAFKTVTSLSIPVETHAGTDSLTVGFGAKIGFPVIITNASQVIAKSFNDTVDAGTVTASATLEGSVYAAAGTFDGVKLLELTFFSEG